METSPPPPDAALSTALRYQLAYTLTRLLPPPVDDTPEGLRARNQAAIAKAAALLPINANEADLAAQCIAARVQAEDILRLLRQNADDIGLVMRLNAQYGSMVRTSLSELGRLMRIQAERHKREALEGAANEDAWTQHIAEQSVLKVVEADAKRQAAPPPEAAPAAEEKQQIERRVSENHINSQDVAFETWMSVPPSDQQSRGPGETDLRRVVREAMAGSYFAGPKLPATARESPGTAELTRPDRRETPCPDVPVWYPDPVVARSLGEVQQRAS